MLAPDVQRRKLAPAFDDDGEITALPSPSEALSPGMFGSTRLPVGAGPSYVNAIMGQTPTATERKYARKASGSISREDSVQIKESEAPTKRNSWSTDLDMIISPYSSGHQPTDMYVHGDLIPIDRLTEDTRQLLLFLREGPPPTPQRPVQAAPIEAEGSKRISNISKHPLRFLKFGRKKAPRSANKISQTDLLRFPVQQKVSSTGKKYRAIQTGASIYENGRIRNMSPSIQESRVSILFTDSVLTADGRPDWSSVAEKDPLLPWPTPVLRKPSAKIPFDAEPTLRVVNCSSPSPIRPEASSPPTPEPNSAHNMAESYQSSLTEHPAMRSFDACRALSSHPVHTNKKSFSLPKLPLPHEDFPLTDNDIDIKHPLPRRFASHPILLQRTASLRSTLYARSVTDSPGPPPPRSPLRPRRDPRTIEGLLADEYERKTTPKIAPSIRTVNEYRAEIQPVQPTVTTDCTGPIPKSPITRKPVPLPTYTVNRRPREDQTRAYRMRDRPAPSQTIDAVVTVPPPLQRQRLRKVRPHLQIPALRPAPLATRASSTTSSNGSGKKITEFTRAPVSAIPSEETPVSAIEKTGYTPTSATNSQASTNIQISPVTLVAEEIPLNKNRSTPKPARVMVKEGKPYAPRPRSASIPRSSLKRRSARMGSATPTRPNSPAPEPLKDETPPLPSPPPNRALPPTPPASGSENPRKSRVLSAGEMRKELPTPPMYEIAPKELTPPWQAEKLKHVASLDQRKRSASKGAPGKERGIIARLEAVEKQNQLLQAALMAVLRTNGELNGPLAGLQLDDITKGPSAWESRIARRSAVSHVASSSNGSALEMYMNTRRCSKNGC